MRLIDISSFLSLTLLAGFTIAKDLRARDGFQTVHLTFHGGPAEYSMAIPADGQVYPTSKEFTVPPILPAVC
jgi:hypothetical protein